MQKASSATAGANGARPGQAQSNKSNRTGKRPTPAQAAWLARGLGQAGGKLPLFDENGKRIDARTVKRCLDEGWVEPWFSNPIKPGWLVCKLTKDGRKLAKSTNTGQSD